MKRKLPLFAAVSICLIGIGLLRADDAANDAKNASPPASSVAVKKLVVFDGDKLGDNAKGWTSAPAGKATIVAQDKEVRAKGKKAVMFHAEGKEFLGCGWNWFGWYPNDSGTNVAGFKNLHFWAKLVGDTKPTLLNITLVANDKDKHAGDSCNVLTYCPGLGDGKWHEVVIPIKDLDAKRGVNLGKVWELMLASWSQDNVNYTLFVDEIAFEGQGDPANAVATTAAAPRTAALSSVSTTIIDGAAAPLPIQVDASNRNIRYVGRWDMSNPAAPRASWTYSLVTAKFKGAAINARLKGGGFYQVTVDGKPTRVIAPKNDGEVYEVAKGLPDAEHTVEIVRRNEGAWIAPITFLGFQLEKGSQLLPLPPRSQRRILIVGDSISCGYGNEATRDQGNPPAKQNGYMTYGPIAARKLGAEIQVVAWSGRMLFPNNTMVEVYPRTLAMDAEPKADLKSWIPDVVVIDLGTNDFRDAKHPPDEQGWINAYKDFIKTIRSTAPQSYVFVASGPMGTDAHWDKWAKTVVDDLHQAGDDRIAYLPFATQDINKDGLGGDWHPNLTTHGKMADRLTQEIEKAVGWK